MQATPTRNERWRTRLRFTVRATERLLAFFGLYFVLFHLFFDLSVMISSSMSPTLRGTSRTNGDWVLSEHFTPHIRKARRWEIVAFHNSEGVQVMKRVVGLPGETVALNKQNQILINGAPIPRPEQIASLKYYAYGNLAGGKSVSCGDGYYLLGDDSVDSQDSRYEGPLAKENVEGRAWIVVWPFSRFHFITP